MGHNTNQPKIKRLFQSADEQLIRAYGTYDPKEQAFPLHIFPLSSVERVTGVGGISYIFLLSGLRIPVNMDGESLARKLYSSDVRGEEVNLDDVTGKMLERVDDLSDIGRRMPDGTVYAGISPDTDTPLFVVPEDTVDWYSPKEVKSLIAEFNKEARHGQSDWRLASQAEWGMIYKNMQKGALKGTFNEYVWYMVNNFSRFSLKSGNGDGQPTEWSSRVRLVRNTKP